MEDITLRLSISTDEYLKLYRGQARSVTAISVDGRTVRFPANILKPFVTRTGISGIFSIRFDNKGKFQAIRRL
ncbi:DUF2835 domain-containing protein [Motiliproteus sp. MSK22-1]|uniref:DUF2835 domain-containing protein n=1 Tax=Motiliproteus sp. MSK22-1 TaxID=1897630 RepID=UPI0009773BB0|nr:DUF2835 domain-containing protein [Motiliproteus sp. MSK22-1]